MSEFADQAPVAPLRVSDELLMSLVSASLTAHVPTPLELQKYELIWIPRTTTSLKSSMRKWQNRTSFTSVTSQLCFARCPECAGHLAQKIRAESSSNARKLRSSGLTPQKSELSSHQIAGGLELMDAGSL